MATRRSRVGRQLAPTWIGAIAVLTGGPLLARMQAETECRLAVVPGRGLPPAGLLAAAGAQRVMQAVGPVMTRFSEIESNRTRLASLGTMAAGLAHELNNPAAAARRAAAEIAESIEVVGASLARFVESGVERSEAEQLVALQREAAARAAGATALDALDASDAEEELLERLESLGVAEPWRIAEPLAAAGVDQEFLDRVAALAGPATDAALRWIAATLSAGRLAAELQDATQRMSDLVGAVKRYAYMDRGGMVEVDVHEGLETTLTVLGHKLKHTTIELRRDYDRTLPKLTRPRPGAEPGLDQPDRQRGRRARGQRHAHDRHGRRRRLRRRHGHRRRAGHPAGRRRARVRPVLHYEGRGRGDRAWPGDSAPDRRRPPWRLDRRRLRAGPHDVQRAAPVRPALTASASARACRSAARLLAGRSRRREGS